MNWMDKFFFYSVYYIPGPAARMDILFWGRRDFQISFFNRHTSRNAWKRHWGSVMVDTGILCSPLMNVKWHSVTWPNTLTTHYWSDFIQSRTLLPNSTFYRILRGFNRTFATGVTCLPGMLTPPDTWSRPFGICICSTCWDKSFFRTCRYFYGLCSSNIPRYFFDFAYSKLETLKFSCMNLMLKCKLKTLYFYKIRSSNKRHCLWPTSIRRDEFIK